ncbi:hypothetical protein V7V80_04515 [Pseudomonas kermanshahensis]|uniref:Uncharacterized protein n=1 Tax=Pseudomonas kermanshahensis TaxID=2745482 RepID=A0ABU8R260_9PSED
MSSISSSTSTASLTMFPINLYGAGAQRLERDAAAAQREAKRKAQHEVDMLAIEYAKIMMQKSIDEALNPATDARLRRDLRNDILNRGIGKVAEPENPDKKKPDESSAVAEWLKILAAYNYGPAIVEASRKPQLGHTRYEPIERDITPDPVALVERQSVSIPDEELSFDQLMEDITGEKP